MATSETPPAPDDWFAPTARPTDSLEGLPAFQLLADLEPAHLDSVLSRTTPATCFDGELLVQAGKEADAVFFVVEGGIRVGGAGGQTAGPGAIVGELGLVDSLYWDSSVVTTGTTRVRRLDRRAFDDLIQADPDAALALMQGTARRLGRALRSVASDGGQVPVAAALGSARRLELLSPSFEFLESLGRLEALAGLPPALRERLTEGAHELRLQDGDLLFRAGGLVDAVFLVVSGAVQSTAPSGSGEAELVVQGPGAWVGASAFVLGESHAASARARGEASALRIPTSTIAPLWASSGSGGLLFTRALTRHLLSTMQHRRARLTPAAAAWPPKASMESPPDSSGAPQDSMSTQMQSRPNATAEAPPVLFVTD